MSAKFLTKVNIRTSPTTSSSKVGIYYEGDIVNYDQIFESEGKLWISYKRGNRRYYCCAKDTNGEWYIDKEYGNKLAIQVTRYCPCSKCCGKREK